nr:hypothetical protein [Streptomyces canus]
MTTNDTASRVEIAKRASVWALAQPTSGACTTAYTRISRDAVELSAPSRSNCAKLNFSRATLGTTRIPITSRSSATGPGKSRVARHESSVRKPPKTSPSENPEAPQAE